MGDFVGVEPGHAAMMVDFVIRLAAS